MSQDQTRIAQTAHNSTEDSARLQLVTFEVDGEEFAVDILSVQEINRMMDITQVPEATACVEGVINLRGRIITVIDLRKRFGLAPTERSSQQRIVVVEVVGRTIGFIVDRVNEVLRIDKSIVEPAPELATARAHNSYIDGVGMLEDRLLILLNLGRLFDDESLGTAKGKAA